MPEAFTVMFGRFSRGISAAILTLSISAVFPVSASASNAVDYVVIGQDGSVEVQRLTTAQAIGLGADATVGVVTGVDSSTVNALLYQRISSASSGAAIEVQDPGIGRSTDTDEEASSTIDYGNEPDSAAPVAGAPTAPTVGAPTRVTPIAAPVVSRATVAITKVKRVGQKFQVTVSAPRGAVVALYRNGKLVSKAAKSKFVVSSAKGKINKLHAVVVIDGTIVSSQSVTFSVRAASR